MRIFRTTFQGLWLIIVLLNIYIWWWDGLFNFFVDCNEENVKNWHLETVKNWLVLVVLEQESSICIYLCLSNVATPFESQYSWYLRLCKMLMMSQKLFPTLQLCNNVYNCGDQLLKWLLIWTLLKNELFVSLMRVDIIFKPLFMCAKERLTSSHSSK